MKQMARLWKWLGDNAGPLTSSMTLLYFPAIVALAILLFDKQMDTRSAIGDVRERLGYNEGRFDALQEARVEIADCWQRANEAADRISYIEGRMSAFEDMAGPVER